MESQQAFARSCASCSPYVEQLSGGQLAPPPRRNVASEKLRRGSKVLRLVLKYDHKDPQFPNQSWPEKQEEEKEEEEVGRFCWGVKVRTEFRVNPHTPR